MRYSFINLFTLIFFGILFILVACNSQTVPPFGSEILYTSISDTESPPITTQKPIGVEGSTLLPENAPMAKHFIGGGGCFEHHEIPTSHDGEVLNQYACDRCHIQSSTLMPETSN